MTVKKKEREKEREILVLSRSALSKQLLDFVLVAQFARDVLAL